MEEIKKETNKTPIPSEKLNALRAAMDKIETVSYTHLTLPTKA